MGKHWCKIHGFTEFYSKGRTNYCKECYNEKKKAKRKELKMRAVEARWKVPVLWI